MMRADASADIGVGHAMRLLALAQELRARGYAVTLAGDLEVPWVAEAYAAAGITRERRPATPAELVDLTRRRGAGWCLLDRYDLGPAWGAALREAGIVVMAMVDGPFGADQMADLYVDQNPGATARAVQQNQIALAGAEYTLFRDDVLALRRLATRGSDMTDRQTRDGQTRDGQTRDGGADQNETSEVEPLRVLAVFGGTDPLGAAPVIAPLLVEAAGDGDGTWTIDLTVVTPDGSWATPLISAAPAGVTLRTSGPLSDLAARAAASDLVVTASGSSVWELMCLGVPLAVVCVIDNQSPGYDMVVAADLAVGLGHLAALREDVTAREAAVTALRQAFSDGSGRSARAERGQAMLDGRGRARVADVLLALDR